MTMENVVDFLRAALPWIVMGLLLAVYFAVSANIKRKSHDNDKKGKAKDTYISEGMALGMCLGVCVSAAIHQNVGIGVSVGMLLGLAIGSSIQKEKNDESGDDKKE